METFPAAVICSIEKYLGNLLYSGIGLRPQLKVELESLEETVAAIVPAFIDARLEENRADEFNRVVIIRALYDVEDILIVLLIEAEESTSRLVSDTTLMEKLRVFFAVEPQVYSTLEMASQIHLIVEKIRRACASFLASKVTTRPVVDHHNIDRTAEPNSVVIGRDADKEKVMAFLFASGGDIVHMSTLAIVGIGGIGKTTLVRLVFNDDRVTDHFDMRIWVGVSSEGLNVGATAKEILRQILRVPAAANDLSSQFKSVFKGKRFLMVLDGWMRWDYHGEKEWSQLHSLLVGAGASGSRILVTSRDMRVAKITKASSVHLLKGLSKEESLSLLMKIVASKKESRSTSFEEVALECAGAPFAIVTAGVHHLGGIISVLKPTYDDLPSHLKPCLAYCSLFPRDYVFNVHELIYLWKAQRLVQMTEIEKTVEQVGQEFVRDLVSSLIFQDSVIDENGNIVECRMHPLFLQLARFMTKGCCTCIETSEPPPSLVRDFESFHQLILAHHVSIVTEEHPLEVLRRVPKNARTLIFLNKTSGIGWPVAEYIFVNLKELRTLRLRRLSVTAVSHFLGRLRHLRHLDLSDSHQIEVLPGSVVNLLNLVTLILKNCCNLKKLPGGIIRMSKLQELDLSGCTGLTHLPNSIGQFVYLWILDLSGCSSLTYLPSGISKLLNLMVLDLSGCSSLTQLPDGIGRFRVLKELNLSGCTSLTHLPESVTQLSSHLKELDLSGCTSLTHLPSGITQLILLTKLDLSGCSSLTHLPNGIGRLELLQTLGCFIVGDDQGNASTIYSIQRLSGLKGHLEIKHLHRVTNNFDKDGPSILSNKLQLQSLKLCWDSSDVIIRGGRATADSVLEKLQPPPNLMRVSIQGYCGYDADAVSKRLYGLTKLVEIDIQECNWCTSLPRFHSLPHLKSIKLRKMRRLDYFGELDSSQVITGSDHFFPALEVLRLEYLPKLKGWRQSNDNGTAQVEETDHMDNLTFPTFSGEVHLDVVHTRSFSYYDHGRDYLTLCTMTARILQRWLGNKVTVTGRNYNASSSASLRRVTPFTSVYNISPAQLNTLKMHDMGDIKFLPEEFFRQLSSLRHLEISRGRTMTTLSGAMIIQLMTALETLKIVDFPELDFENDVKFKLAVVGSSSKIRQVRIGAVPKMKSLPMWFEHLTELEELVISDCIGLRSLQDECRNFNFMSLRSLEIYGCQGLRFSRAVILQLIRTVKSLKICGCPELDITAGPAGLIPYSRIRRLHIQQVNDRMKRLPWWIRHLQSLEILEILYCKNLEILPYFLTKLRSLREIRVEYCGKLSEWCGPKRAHVYSIFDLPKTCRSPMMQMLFRASEAAKRSRKDEYTALVKLYSLFGEAKAKDATEKHKRVRPVSGFGSSLIKQHRPLRAFFRS